MYLNIPLDAFESISGKKMDGGMKNVEKKLFYNTEKPARPQKMGVLGFSSSVEEYEPEGIQTDFLLLKKPVNQESASLLVFRYYSLKHFFSFSVFFVFFRFKEVEGFFRILLGTGFFYLQPSLKMREESSNRKIINYLAFLLQLRRYLSIPSFLSSLSLPIGHNVGSNPDYGLWGRNVQLQYLSNPPENFLNLIFSIPFPSAMEDRRFKFLRVHKSQYLLCFASILLIPPFFMVILVHLTVLNSKYIVFEEGLKK